MGWCRDSQVLVSAASGRQAPRAEAFFFCSHQKATPSRFEEFRSKQVNDFFSEKRSYFTNNPKISHFNMLQLCLVSIHLLPMSHQRSSRTLELILLPPVKNTPSQACMFQSVKLLYKFTKKLYQFLYIFYHSLIQIIDCHSSAEHSCSSANEKKLFVDLKCPFFPPTFPFKLPIEHNHFFSLK